MWCCCHGHLPSTLGVADNPFIFWDIALMMCCCLLCLLISPSHATCVLGVIVVVVIRLKLELIVAWIAMDGITKQCLVQSLS